jgi:hypothetical protein
MALSWAWLSELRKPMPPRLLLMALAVFVAEALTLL